MVYFEMEIKICQFETRCINRGSTWDTIERGRYGKQRWHDQYDTRARGGNSNRREIIALRHVGGISALIRRLEQPQPGHLAELSSLFGMETITIETIEANYTLIDELMQEMDKVGLYCLPTIPMLTSIICEADEDRYVSRIPRRVSTQWSFKTKQSLESSCIKNLVESLYLLTSTVNEPD